MSDRMRSISLFQFRQRATELIEPVEVVTRDRDGNFRALGYFTPYVTRRVDTTPITEDQPPVPGGVTAIRDGGYVTEPMTPGPPSPVSLAPAPRMVKTPQEAAVAVGSVHPFSKAEQAGRKKR